MRKLIASLVAVLVATVASAQTPVEVDNTGTPGKASASRTVKAAATITAIDVAARTVTLRSGSSEPQTIKVGPEVKRFAEFAVGDVIKVEYDQGLAFEFQPAGSENVPLTAIASGARAESDKAPGGVAAAGVRGTVTVTAIDMAKRLVSITGPEGNVYQVKAGPKVQLEKLKVGDRLLATYVEAVAIKLEKAKKK
jgi:hypothetical protein